MLMPPTFSSSPAIGHHHLLPTRHDRVALAWTLALGTVIERTALAQLPAHFCLGFLDPGAELLHDEEVPCCRSTECSRDDTPPLGQRRPIDLGRRQVAPNGVLGLASPIGFGGRYPFPSASAG